MEPRERETIGTNSSSARKGRLAGVNARGDKNQIKKDNREIGIANGKNEKEKYNNIPMKPHYVDFGHAKRPAKTIAVLSCCFRSA